MKKILIGSLIATSLLLGNNGVEVNLNDETLEVELDINLNKYYDVSNNSNYYLSAGHLRTEHDNEEIQSLSTVGLKVLNPFTDDHGISLGLGMKSVYTNQLSKTFFALPLSVYGKVEFNEVVYIDAEVSYAPKVLSFGDAESYTDVKAKVNYKVLADGYVFIGARNIETKYENGTRTKFDTTAFAGFEVRF